MLYIHTRKGKTFLGYAVCSTTSLSEKRSKLVGVDM